PYDRRPAVHRLEAGTVVVDREVDGVDLARMEASQHVPEEREADEDRGDEDLSGRRLPLRRASTELAPARTHRQEDEPERRQEHRRQSDYWWPAPQGRAHEHDDDEDADRR